MERRNRNILICVCTVNCVIILSRVLLQIVIAEWIYKAALVAFMYWWLRVIIGILCFIDIGMLFYFSKEAKLIRISSKAWRIIRWPIIIVLSVGFVWATYGLVQIGGDIWMSGFVLNMLRT